MWRTVPTACFDRDVIDEVVRKVAQRQPYYGSRQIWMKTMPVSPPISSRFFETQEPSQNYKEGVIR